MVRCWALNMFNEHISQHGLKPKAQKEYADKFHKRQKKNNPQQKHTHLMMQQLFTVEQLGKY